MALNWWEHLLMTWLQIAVGVSITTIFGLICWKVVDWVEFTHRQIEARKTKIERLWNGG